MIRACLRFWFIDCGSHGPLALNSYMLCESRRSVLGRLDHTDLLRRIKTTLSGHRLLGLTLSAVGICLRLGSSRGAVVPCGVVAGGAGCMCAIITSNPPSRLHAGHRTSTQPTLDANFVASELLQLSSARHDLCAKFSLRVPSNPLRDLAFSLAIFQDCYIRARLVKQRGARASL